MLTTRRVVLVLCFCLAAHSVSSRPTFGKRGLVVSDSVLASQAGAQTLQAGGNAADAAVTTGFVLAVTRPYYASLGGGGFMIVRFNDEVLALDHREWAPSRATRDMYLKAPKTNASTVGALAVATPGTVRGLFDLHRRFGRRSWQADIEPAVALAAQGFMVSEGFARMIEENIEGFSAAGKKYFSNRGKPYQIGDRFKQPQLAQALVLIQKYGADAIYESAIARDIVDTTKGEGGILEPDDLRSYRARWAEPLHARVFGADVYSMPPPSSGGTLLISELKMAELIGLSRFTPFGSQELHVMAEIMNRAFFDRQYLADPDAMRIQPDAIYAPERIRKWVATIDTQKKTAFERKAFAITNAVPGSVHEGEHTTHYSVVDADGNAVAATTTLNSSWGSGVVTERFGIALNNEMDDFTTKPGKPNQFNLTQSPLNEVRPGKTPLSSMTPTIIEKDGKLLLALGAPGGPSIINAVFQIGYRALTAPHFDLDELVQAPRLHHQHSPDTLFHDKMLSPDIRQALRKRGHTLSEQRVGRVYAIRITPEGLLEGAFDAREEGGASGY
ncbi:MAG: gamma-glutamyltransferase [Gammaproteobacteria bacterium]